MKHTLKKLSDTQVHLHVTGTAQEIEEAKQHALKHLAKEVKVAGFRKGHVPAHVAEKNIDANLLANEVVEHAINHLLNEVAVAEELRILDQPKIEVKKFVPYDTLEFEATIDIVPEIKLGNYKNLKVKREKVQLEQKEIDEVVERLRTNMAEKKEVTRKAQDSDEVTIDFVGKKDNEAFDGGTATDYALVLGSNTFIPGFEPAIVGHKVGDTFDVPLTFPKDYQAEHLKGADVVFTVTLNKITEVVKPELTDELAKKVGPFESVAELLEDIRRELTAQKERVNDNQYKDDLVGALVGVSKVPVPEILVEDQLRSIEQDLTQNLSYRGMTLAQYAEQRGFKDVDELITKEIRVAAEQRVQAGLVLAELSKVEKVLPSKDELDARHAEMIAQYPNMKDQFDTPEARRDLANRVMTEKTVDRLVELNS